MKHDRPEESSRLHGNKETESTSTEQIGSKTAVAASDDNDKMPALHLGREFVQVLAEIVDFAGVLVQAFAKLFRGWLHPMFSLFWYLGTKLRDIAEAGHAQAIVMSPSASIATARYTDKRRSTEEVSQNIIANNLLQRGVFIALGVMLLLYMFGFVNTTRDGTEQRKLARLQQREEVLTDFATVIPRSAFELNRTITARNSYCTEQYKYEVAEQWLSWENNSGKPSDTANKEKLKAAERSRDSALAEFKLRRDEWLKLPQHTGVIALADARYVAHFRYADGDTFVVSNKDATAQELDSLLRALGTIFEIFGDIDAENRQMLDALAGELDQVLADLAIVRAFGGLQGRAEIFAKEIRQLQLEYNKAPCTICESTFLDEKRQLRTAIESLTTFEQSSTGPPDRSEIDRLRKRVEEIRSQAVRTAMRFGGSGIKQDSTIDEVLSSLPRFPNMRNCEDFACRKLLADALRKACYQSILILYPRIMALMGQQLAGVEPGDTLADRLIFNRLTNMVGN